MRGSPRFLLLPGIVPPTRKQGHATASQHALDRTRNEITEHAESPDVSEAGRSGSTVARPSTKWVKSCPKSVRLNFARTLSLAMRTHHSLVKEA